MKKNLTDYESLERDAERGFEILGRESDNGWEIEVRFDDASEPHRPDPGRMPKTRDEAIQTGREIAKMGG